jgi:multiple sugar transport system permease protein
MIVREIEDLSVSKVKKPLGKCLTPWLFLLPHLLFFTVFIVFPFFYGIILSFYKSNLINEMEFVGFDNYVAIFTEEPFRSDFLDGLKHTALFTVVSVPLVVFVPLGLAVWLFAIKNEKIRGVFQAILYSTTILSVSTVVFIWRYMMDGDNGFINLLFELDVNWHKQPHAWIIIFALTLWAGVGGNMIIFLSAIASIPKSQYEAANIDGIGKWRQFFRLTIPSLKFPLVYSLITGTIGAFNVFGQPYLYVASKGTYETVIMEIKDYAFEQQMAGIASAMSVVLGFIIVAVSFVQFKLMKADE